MTDERPASNGAPWTIPVSVHIQMRLEELERRLDQRDESTRALAAAEERFQSERDRRYAEVKNAEEKALKVKEEADRTALQLAREIQTYKDEKANELRSQIERERGSYATQSDLRGAVEKIEATIKPLSDWIATRQGRSTGFDDGWKYVSGAIVVAGVIVGIFVKFH